MATGGRRLLSKAKVAGTWCITTVVPPRRSLYSHSHTNTLWIHTHTLSYEHSLYTPTLSYQHTLYTHKHTRLPTHSLYTPTLSLTNTISIHTNTPSHQHTLFYSHKHSLTNTHSMHSNTHRLPIYNTAPIYILPSYYMRTSSLADTREAVEIWSHYIYVIVVLILLYMCPHTPDICWCCAWEDERE